jgi:nucleoid-associated protein EbfC
MAKGFKGIPGNMQGFLEQAQNMQNKVMKAQEEARKKIVSASAGGNMVNVEIDGHYVVHKLSIDPQVVDPTDVGMLEDLVKAAFSEALTIVGENLRNEVEKVTGMPIPGLF